MFATSVGLVMKGLQAIDKTQEATKVAPAKAEVPEPEETNKIVGHSQDKSLGWFDKVKKFFDEDGN
jgi:hypothetical protein